MNVLDGFEPMELPREKRNTKWNTRETLDAFTKSGNECMGKRFDTDEDAMSAYMAFKSYTKKFGDFPVTVHKRGNVMCLVRNDL